MAKASTAARGYGRAHREQRKRWESRVSRGGVLCARCHQPIEPGRPWDMGHDDTRQAWTGPEHRTCNRKAGGINGAMVTNEARRRPVRQSRDW